MTKLLQASGTGPSGLLVLSWVQSLRSYVLVQGTAKEFLPLPALKGVPSYKFRLWVVLAPTGETPIVPVPCSGAQALKSGGRSSPTEL